MQQRRRLPAINAPSITETTMPLLTTVLAGFSVTLIAISTGDNFPSITCRWLPFEPTTTVVAALFLTMGVLLFLFSTFACIHAQAYNYFALTNEARAAWQIKEADKDHYIVQWSKWYIRAVISGDVGVVLFLCAAGILFWPFAIFLSCLFWLAAICEAIWIVLTFKS